MISLYLKLLLSLSEAPPTACALGDFDLAGLARLGDGCLFSPLWSQGSLNPLSSYVIRVRSLSP